MSRATIVTTLAALVLALPAELARARPPSAGELPTIAAVVKDLEDEVRRAEEAAREAARDADRDFVREYAMGTREDSRDHKRMVDLVDDRELDRKKPGLREEAAKVLKERWSRDRASTLKARKELSGFLVKLLNRTGHDEKSNRLAIEILIVYWGTDKDYKLEAGWREKNKAIQKWLKFLQS